MPLLPIFSYFIIHQPLAFFLPPSCGGFYKIHVVCLSVRQFSIFLRNGSLVFSDFLHDGRSLEYLKTYCLKTEPFFPQIWTKMTPKWVFWIFWKMLTLVFLEIIWKENYCHFYFTTNPISGKIQVLKLRAKILSGNQIAGFFLKYNISRKTWMMNSIFRVEINIKVFYKLILSFWVCVTRHAQSTWTK